MGPTDGASVPPASVTMRMGSLQGAEGQAEYFSQSHWNDGKIVSLHHVDMSDGAIVNLEQISVNHQAGTLTVTST